MADYNRVILIGNCTRDPELRYSPKGTAMCKLGLAINRHWTSEGGERKEEVTFVDVDFFGRTAESVGQYVRKGRSVMAEGRLKLEQWDDKQTGQKRSRLGVLGEACQFLGAKQEGAAAPASRPAATPVGEAPKPAVTKSETEGDSEIPF